jgi:hypothetical protein
MQILETDLKEAKIWHYLNKEYQQYQDFNETKTNDRTWLADYLVTNLKLQPEQSHRLPPLPSLSPQQTRENSSRTSYSRQVLIIFIQFWYR